MDHSNSTETNSFSASPGIPSSLWNPPLKDLAACHYSEPDQSRSDPHVPLLED
jgi:hypothetical protein